MEAPESLGHVKGKRASVRVRDDGGVSTHAEESSTRSQPATDAVSLATWVQRRW